MLIPIQQVTQAFLLVAANLAGVGVDLIASRSQEFFQSPSL